METYGPLSKILDFFAVKGKAIEIEENKPVQQKPQSSSQVDLIAKIYHALTTYHFPQSPVSHPEHFYFTTDVKQKYLVVDPSNPSRIIYKSFGALPWHIAFTNQVMHNHSGIHRWTVLTSKTTDYIKIGVYFGNRSTTLRTDFAFGKMMAGAGTYFVGSGEDIAGIDYCSGQAFGGVKNPKIGKIAKGILSLDFDTSNCIITIRKGSSSCTFSIRKLSELNTKDIRWKSIFWVAIGSGGPYSDHDATITQYTVLGVPKL